MFTRPSHARYGILARGARAEPQAGRVDGQCAWCAEDSTWRSGVRNTLGQTDEGRSARASSRWSPTIAAILPRGLHRAVGGRSTCFTRFRRSRSTGSRRRRRRSTFKRRLKLAIRSAKEWRRTMAKKEYVVGSGNVFGGFRTSQAGGGAGEGRTGEEDRRRSSSGGA